MLLSLVIALILQAQTTAPSAAPAEAPRMTTYYMVLLSEGPKHAEQGSDMQARQEAHLARMAQLHRQGINLLYGPFLDEGRLRGIAVLNVSSADAAREIFAADPLVEVHYLTQEVRPWYGPVDFFRQAPDTTVTEPLVFGFLVRGPKWTRETTPATEEIQRGHLAYMTELNRQGKLVAAGPFVDDSDIRGIVVYRVATVDEARELASGDPAVKAGRLVIEPHPWMTLKGILK
jgi:uncharacterized protein YciI